MPVLTSEDKALTKVLWVEKGWNVDRMMREFPAGQWKRQTLYDLVRKIDQTGSTEGWLAAVDRVLCALLQTPEIYFD